MTCTDCDAPLVVRPKTAPCPPPPSGTRYHGGHGLCTVCASRASRQDPKPKRVRQRACNVELALKGEDNCPACKLARADLESPMNAGASVPERNGIRRWVG